MSAPALVPYDHDDQCNDDDDDDDCSDFEDDYDCYDDFADDVAGVSRG